MNNGYLAEKNIVLHQNLFSKIISKENLLASWQEFKAGKKDKIDVQFFEHNLAENLIYLHNELKNKLYHHGNYTSFCIQDPKLRQISKASVRDRVVHHAIVRVLEPIFEKTFIFDSYSSRIGKGTHRAILRFKKFAWKLSKNNTKIVWVLKCDIKKYFDSVDHSILLSLIQRKISDADVLWLLKNIVNSFQKTSPKCGIPLGNLTSQLFSNVYLNPLDHFVKRTQKERYYIRYADDFVILSRDRGYLENIISTIRQYIVNILRLELHPDKVIIRKWSQGIDFLGYIVFPCYTILRTKTKKRMLREIRNNYQLLREGLMSRDKFKQSLHSYLGMLKHCRKHTIYEDIRQIFVLKGCKTI